MEPNENGAPREDEDAVEETEAGTPSLSWRSLLSGAARANLQRPFSTLLLLTLFVTVVSNSLLDPTATTFFLSLVLIAVETYIDIAVILAAAEVEPEPSGDVWLRGAFQRKVFWRYTLTSIAVYFVTGIAFALLLVPGFIVAGRFGLAQTTAVLDARRETLPIARSVELTKPARPTISILFGVFLVLPAVGLQIAALAGVDFDAWLLGLNLLLVVTARTATIALARAYVALGGVVRSYTPERSR